MTDMDKMMIEKVAITKAGEILPHSLSNETALEYEKRALKALTDYFAAYNPDDRLREALEGLVAEFEKFSRYGSPIAMEANEAMQRAKSALSPLPQGDDFTVPQLTDEETAELVERINANPLLQPDTGRQTHNPIWESDDELST